MFAKYPVLYFFLLLKANLYFADVENPVGGSSSAGVSTFNGSEKLVPHNLAYAESKQYKCTECDEAFNDANDYREHQCTHTGESTYECVFCGTSFPEAGLLKSHLHVHIGESPYSCSDCGQAFTVASDLRQHERIHTNQAALGQAGDLEPDSQAHSEMPGTPVVMFTCKPYHWRGCIVCIQSKKLCLEVAFHLICF